LDFDNQGDYEFSFDVALAPQIDAKLTKDDKLPYYDIQASEKMINEQIENIRSNYGDYNQVNEVEDKDMVKGRLVELQADGDLVAEGLIVKEATLLPSFMKEEEEKAKFIGAKLNSVVFFNPAKAYDNNEAELASLLRVKKEELPNYQGNFAFEIEEITRYKEAELNQELFDKTFEPGTIDSEDAFRKAIKKNIEFQLQRESDFKFWLDTQKILKEKYTGAQFPDEFLKKWLLASDENRTPESVEEDYPKIIEDLILHLIIEKLAKDNGVVVEEAEISEYAKYVTRMQLAQYGMQGMPEEVIEKYSQDLLKKEESIRDIINKLKEEKLIAVIKEKVSLERKEISIDDFTELFKG
jgi:trigger factor